MIKKRRLIPPIKIHPIIIIFMIIGIFTGSLPNLLIIFLIVFIHEFGHYFAAKMFNWKIIHIKLWIFGGVLVTDEYSSRPLKEQLLVTLAGPFLHFPLYLIIYLLGFSNIFSDSLLKLMFLYNTIILIFNFLPILPLDGGKILFIFLCSLFPYRLTHSVSLILSIALAAILLSLQLIFYPFTLSAILVMIYLILENLSEWRHRFYIFIQFLLQRINDSKEKRKGVNYLTVPEHMKLVDVLSNFMLEKNYIIKVLYDNNQKKELSEKECIEGYFKEYSIHERIGNLPL